MSLLLFFVLTDTEDAAELMVLGLNREKLLIFFMSIKLLLPSLTTSLAMRGLMWEVLVSWGWPKSMI